MRKGVDEASKASVYAEKCAAQISFITTQIQKAASALELNSLCVATLQIFRRGCGREAELGGSL